MLKTVLIAGVAAAGGAFVASKAAEYLDKPDGPKFDDNWSPQTKGLVKTGLGAGVGVGLYVALRSAF